MRNLFLHFFGPLLPCGDFPEAFSDFRGHKSPPDASYTNFFAYICTANKTFLIMPEISIDIFALPPQAGKAPMYQQLAERIQELVTTGSLHPGDALPSSRALASALGISRKTVVTAYDRLVYAGWVEGKDRVGLFIADRTMAAVPQNDEDGAFDSAHMLTIDDGRPDASIAPVKEMARSSRQLMSGVSAVEALTGTFPAGRPALRKAISTTTLPERGVEAAEPTEIFVCQGAQMALFIIANALLHPGDAIAIGTPGFPPAEAAFKAAGLTVVPVAVDADGLSTEQLEKAIGRYRVKALYVTPRHHYPTMVSLSRARRQQLATIAARHNLLVIEDDYDADIRYEARPTLPLVHKLDRAASLYVGSFTAAVSSALRVGFVVGSAEHVKRLANYRSLIDVQGDGLQQEMMADLISCGDIHRHALRASRLYRERQQYLVRELRTHLSGRISYSVPDGGLALWVEPTAGISKVDLEARLHDVGLSIPVFSKADDEGLPTAFNGSNGRSGMRIGYASLSNADVDEMVEKLSRALE